MTAIESFDLGLHSKEIFLQAEYKIQPLLSHFNYLTPDPTPGNNAQSTFEITPPFEFKQNDFDGALQPGYYEGVQPFFYSGPTYPAGILTRTLDFRYKVNTLIGFNAFNECPTESDSATDGIIQLVLKIKTATSSLINEEIILEELPSANYALTLGGGAPIVPINFEGTHEIVIRPDCNFEFFIRFIGHDYGGVLCTNHYTLKIWFDETVSYLNYYENSLQPPSSTKVYLLYEAFTRVSESITGSLGCFRSDFFGGIASLLYAYDADGCGRYIALTNGLNIRQLKTKANTLFPISVSFKQLFYALNAIYSLGMRVEMEDGIEKIR